jgi:hypothetical protein
LFENDEHLCGQDSAAAGRLDNAHRATEGLDPVGQAAQPESVRIRSPSTVISDGRHD